MRKEEGSALILYSDAWPVGGRIGTESGLPVDVVVIDGGLELASDPTWVSLEDTTDLVRPNRFLGPPATALAGGDLSAACRAVEAPYVACTSTTHYGYRCSARLVGADVSSLFGLTL